MILPANQHDPEVAELRDTLDDMIAFLGALDDETYRKMFGDLEAMLANESEAS